MGSPGFHPSVTVSTSRNFKIRGVTFENEDGTSRQELLAMIKEREPPFDDDLQISLERYEHDGKTAYYVNVNGYIVGSVESSISQYITEHYNQISGIHDFYVGSFQAEDTGETVYYANARLSISLKEPTQEVFSDDHAAAQAASTQRLTLFLDAQALSSLNLAAFMEYSNMVRDAASAVMDGGDADSDYADALTNELSLIRAESSARSITLKAEKSKYNLAKDRNTYLSFSIVFVSTAILLSFFPISAFLHFFSILCAVIFSSLTLAAFSQYREQKESAVQTSDPDEEFYKLRWVLFVFTLFFLGASVLSAVFRISTFLSIFMFIISVMLGVGTFISFYQYWNLEEDEDEKE